MKVEVLGTGCAKCNKLEAMARAAADRVGVDCEIEHVRDITEIVRRGVMSTPALAIDGKVVVSGRMPSEAELTALITSPEA
jgi:small redox-active disulfide protein 2